MKNQVVKIVSSFLTLLIAFGIFQPTESDGLTGSATTNYNERIYLKLVTSSQGELKGSESRDGFRDRILISGYSSNLTFDPNGTPNTQKFILNIGKLIDKSTLPMLNAINNDERILNCTITVYHFFRQAQNSFTIQFNNAKIIKQEINESAFVDQQTEKLTIAYQGIPVMATQSSFNESNIINASTDGGLQLTTSNNFALRGNLTVGNLVNNIPVHNVSSQVEISNDGNSSLKKGTISFRSYFDKSTQDLVNLFSNNREIQQFDLQMLSMQPGDLRNRFSSRSARLTAIQLAPVSTYTFDLPNLTIENKNLRQSATLNTR